MPSFIHTVIDSPESIDIYLTRFFFQSQQKSNVIHLIKMC